MYANSTDTKSSRKGSTNMDTKKKQSQKEAVEEFHRTRDPLLLQHRLGHKNIRSTFNFIMRHNLYANQSERGSPC